VKGQYWASPEEIYEMACRNLVVRYFLNWGIGCVWCYVFICAYGLWLAGLTATGQLPDRLTHHPVPPNHRSLQEYEAEGYAWERALEEDQLFWCPDSGEYVHPAHLEFAAGPEQAQPQQSQQQLQA
jgi:hypothetical protein